MAMVTVSYSRGEKVSFKGVLYTITKVVNLEHLLATNDSTGELEKLELSKLEPYKEVTFSKTPLPNLTNISDSDWELANKRFEIIKPLLELGYRRTSSHVRKQATGYDLSPATLYRWIKKYESSGKLSSLIRRSRQDKGKSRLEEEQQRILEASIEKHFLKPERPFISVAYKNYKVDCKNTDTPPCSYKTYQRAARKLAPKMVAERRYNTSIAREKYEEKTGKFPQGRYPLDVVQIDHTKPNVILVDDAERKPIGRPWVTFAIDVYSRMILGFYLSLEAPSATSVALCLTHSIVRKDSWLRLNHIDSQWPCWGLMRVLHADNGPDFRCKALDKACEEYQIQLNWRPLGRPEYGGHVERLMRTVKIALNDIEGTTFINPSDRGKYDSEGRAIFTFSEFQRWLVTYITGSYHQERHSALNTSPLAKFEEGLFNSIDTPALGLPEIIEDERRLYLDFLPFERRTVQTYGIALDNITYFHPAISKWVGVKADSEDGKFTVKYELHQINHIYFLDPDTEDYIEVPRVHRTADDMTRFELKKIQTYLRQKGCEQIDEHAIIEAHRQLNELADSAKQKTKSQRRLEQRKKQAKAAVKHLEKKTAKTPFQEAWQEEEPFDDIDLDI